MAKKKSFDTAYNELEGILDQIQSEETGIDSLSAQLKKAGELVKFCKNRLREISEEVNNLNEEE